MKKTELLKKVIEKTLNRKKLGHTSLNIEDRNPYTEVKIELYNIASVSILFKNYSFINCQSDNGFMNYELGLVNATIEGMKIYEELMEMLNNEN